MHIRQENHQDFKAVDTVIQQAFKSAEHSDGNEQNLVSRLRKTSAFIPELSLVAEENNHIIGYILFTKVQIGQTTQLALGAAGHFTQSSKARNRPRIDANGTCHRAPARIPFFTCFGESRLLSKRGISTGRTFQNRLPV